ncbi:MAG: L-threonylcarbamoyladenylate synthase [Gammaproteobacteria bacterium]|nr:L-threonylcarbamoyladenylate synthase [Gammaproteobacteria bacterium]
MSQYFEIHTVNPQMRLIKQAVDIINRGGVIVYPTDSSYALGCHLGDKNALAKLRRIRRIDEKHNLTLVCNDLSEIATYAKIENTDYRMLKSLTPGPYTFILNATHEVPRRLMHPKRRTIGIRVVDHPVVQALLDELGQPLMSCTLIMPGEELPVTEVEDVRAALEHQVDLIIDGGHCGLEPTTVIRLNAGTPELRLQGKGTDHGLD